MPLNLDPTWFSILVSIMKTMGIQASDSVEIRTSKNLHLLPIKQKPIGDSLISKERQERRVVFLFFQE